MTPAVPTNAYAQSCFHVSLGYTYPICTNHLNKGVAKN